MHLPSFHYISFIRITTTLIIVIITLIMPGFQASAATAVRRRALIIHAVPFLPPNVKKVLFELPYPLFQKMDTYYHVLLQIMHSHHCEDHSL